MIELTNVTKRFHTLVAVDRLSLTINQGEVIGILGPNGAGKTTLFKLIAGILQPDEGTLRPENGRWPIFGYKPERLLFPGHMRVSDYLELVARLANTDGKRIAPLARAHLESVNLTAAAGKRIGDCSKGMRQRLGLAQALVGDPPLLLLDEPTNGLDPEGQADICRYIKALHSSGKTIVLASHQLHEVTEVCTHIVIMHQGRVHYQSRMDEAIATRPKAIIQLDRSVEALAPLLASLHPEIEVDGHQVVLNREAMALRRHVLSMLLAAGFDVLTLEQSRVTLAEIYAQAVQ